MRLSEGTTAYSESVTVTPDVFRAPPDPVPSSSVLGSAELQNLRGVLADDPLRAVQVLPGVATGDDLRSEFTVRGSDFRHLTFTVDGFATPYLLHTVRGVEDRGPTGSVAMINSDVLDDVTLLNGSYSQRYSRSHRRGSRLPAARRIARAPPLPRRGERDQRVRGGRRTDRPASARLLADLRRASRISI